MKTTYVVVDAENPDTGAIGRAAAVIRGGGLVAFPTETVYGLGADATSSAAVLRIYAAKERDRSDPLIVHVADIAAVAMVAAGMPPLARKLADRFWPGPLTLVLERGPGIAPEVSGGRTTVAVRVPSHPVAQALLRGAGLPIAAPSANRFTRTSATTAAHVREDLDGRVEIVLDAGPATAGLESTVVAVQGSTVRILRPGAVTREAIEAVVSRDVKTGSGLGAGASPGMMAKHYAPRTPLVYFRAPSGATELHRAVARALSERQRVGVLAVDEDVPLLADSGPGLHLARLGSVADPDGVGRRLFAAMRELDEAALDVIFARRMGKGGLWTAIDDRLRRAASTAGD